MSREKLALGYMAKYRLLTEGELEEFKDEFVKYLVVNGITAEEWERMKVEDNDTAEKIFNLFSDVILEGVLRNVQFLELRSKSYIQAVQCLKDKMIMVAVSSDDPNLDLTAQVNMKDHLDSIKIHKGEKAYKESREEELFEMTTKGFQISQGELFKALILATVD
ncbi:MAG: DUF6495 family protein [Flavobacteriales bacterium]|nr:DUF6495 family protein [Flavobacteriales bacterium]